MRTRSRGPVAPPAAPRQTTSPIPRKRRSSTASRAVVGKDAGNVKQERSSDGPAPTQQGTQNTADDAQTPVSTPRKAKRIRVSDEASSSTIRDASDNSPSSHNQSTGITPSINRMIPFGNNRRRTLPAHLDDIPECPTSPRHPLIQQIQFEPLRDILDARMKRRLRRSHLSEEMNDIFAERREDGRNRRELAILREQGAQNEQRIKELMLELETQRQFNIHVDTEEEEHSRAMREELDQLRQELEAAKNGENHGSQSAETNYGTDWLSEEDLGFGDIPGSPAQQLDIWIPSQGKYDNQQPAQQAEEEPTLTDVAVQASLPPPPQSQSSGHQTDLGATRELESLRKELAETTQRAAGTSTTVTRIHDTLIGLGFVGFEGAHSPPGAPKDVSSLGRAIDGILDAIDISYRNARVEVEHLLPGETVPGINESSAFLPVLVTHIRHLVADLREERRVGSGHAQSESALRGNLNSALERAADAENRLTICRAHYNSSKNELGAKERMIQDLELVNRARLGFLDQKDERIENLEKELERLKEELAQEQDENAKLSEQNQSFSSNISSLKEQNSSLSSSNSGLKNKNSNANTRTSVNRDRANDQVLRIQELEQELKETELSRKKLGVALESYRQEVVSLEVEVSKIEDQNKNLIEKNQELKEALKHAQGVLHGYVSKTRDSVEGAANDVYEAGDEAMRGLQDVMRL